MKALYELAEMVHNTRIKEVELVQENRNDDSSLMQLLRGVLNKTFASDQEAAQALLNVDAGDQTYQRLRRRLKRSLLNAVFFFDLPLSDYNERQRAYHESYKTWAAAKILLAKNANHIGIELCHKLLKKAEKFDFTDLVMDISRNLRLHYATREGNIKKYEKYNELYKQYERIWIEENLAEELYLELVLRYVNSQAVIDETHSKALEFYTQIEGALQRNTSFRLHLCGMLIRQVIYSSVNDWQGTIQVCNEAIRFFLAKPYNAAVPLQIAYHHQLYAYIQLLQFEEGQQAALSCLKYLEPGSFNWFKYQELYFLLCMNTRQFEQAFVVFKETLANRRFQFLASAAAEVWKIYEAYLYYLHAKGEIKAPEAEVTLSRFRVHRFLNDTPIFSRDKKGMNIPILIAEILFTLRDKKYSQTLSSIENIDRYCTRYLRQGETFRSNCFIKMLLAIPACNFHREAVVRKTEKLHKRLLTQSGNYPRAEIEIIPYEHLWEFVLSSLSNGSIRARRN
jgi:hypothetical protein